MGLHLWLDPSGPSDEENPWGLANSKMAVWYFDFEPERSPTWKPIQWQRLLPTSWVCHSQFVETWDCQDQSQAGPTAATVEAFLIFSSCQDSSIWPTQPESGGPGFYLLALSLFLVPRSRWPLNGENRLQSPLIRGFWTSSFTTSGQDRHLLVGVTLRG